jgi:S-methylmethionine-dependent homocysteine/selenocysteine methylase
MYRDRLPQLDGNLFLADGGMETTLIFHHGFDLPYFAAFELLRTPAGCEALRSYFGSYANLARQYGAGLLLDTPTWRASSDWGAKLEYGRNELANVNRRAVEMLEDFRRLCHSRGVPMVVCGCVGPRGDGYAAGQAMSEREAEAYHRAQVETFASTSADMIAAMTMTYVEEAVGIVRAAQACRMPVSVSFTVETDGRLPGGEDLKSAIQRTDATTGGYPAYYMINCAHTSHFEHVLHPGEPWVSRIRGIRANASCRSHAELNESTDLDIGNPGALAADYARLLRRFPSVNVIGGCCGTDERHVGAMAAACAPLFHAELAAGAD